MQATVSELAEVREIFGLTKAEMADLLGRRAQSLAKWETRGVPPAKRAVYSYFGRLFSYGGRGGKHFKDAAPSMV